MNLKNGISNSTAKHTSGRLYKGHKFLVLLCALLCSSCAVQAAEVQEPAPVEKCACTCSCEGCECRVDVPAEGVGRRIPEPQPYIFDVPLGDDLQAYIREKSTEYEVPVELVIAVIEAESSFRSWVVSPSYDYGLMQINYICHSWLRETLGVRDFLDPYDNVLCGIWLLGENLKATDGDIEKALMCYNLGETGAKRWWEQGITSTDYSKRVIELYEKYKEESRSRGGTR